MDHTMHTALEATELNHANLMGATIYGPYDEKIGTVADVQKMGPAMKVIVDVGGFLGIGSTPVALDASQLSFMRDEDGEVHATTPWTKEQVKDLSKQQV